MDARRAAWPAPSCSTRGPAGPGASSTLRPCCSSRCRRPTPAGFLGHLIGPAPLDDHAAARLRAIAEGNPLFGEEVVAMLIDDGVLSSGEGEGSSAAELTAIAVTRRFRR
jgi:hypothetical protein